MMRTEVKIGISVAILLVVVVVGYVVIARTGDSKPAGNESDSRVARANNAPSIIYDNTANRTTNTSWPSAGGSNTAANNTGGRSIWENSNYSSNNAAANRSNAAGNTAGNTSMWGGYSSSNAANNAASNAVAFNAANNAAGNGSSIVVDWGNWDTNAASNNAAGQTGTGTNATDQARTYTVKSGDTFSSIAQEMYGDRNQFQRLVDANPSVDPRSMQVGTVLKVPPLPARTLPGTGTAGAGESGNVTAAAGGTKTYVVVEGDTLWKIAEKTLGNGARGVDAIKKANPGLTDNIKPGQKIILPDSATAPATANTNTVTPRPATNRPADASTNGPARPRFR